MKDFTNFEVNAERIALIKQQFAAGESEAQVAFQSLVQYVLDELEAHRDGDKGAPRGLMEKMKKELVIAGFGEKGTLAKSYLNPSFSLASAIHYGKASICILEAWENFLTSGEDLEGSVTRGPIYTPGRLNAAWGRLNKDEDTPFRVDMEGIVAVTSEGEYRWHTLTIEALKKLNRTKDIHPKVGASLMRVLGNPENLDKRPGELAKVIRGLRKDNESLKSEVISNFCDSLDGIVADLRADMSVTLAECEVEAANARKVEAEEKRIARARERAGAPIEEQEQVDGEAVTLPEEVEA